MDALARTAVSHGPAQAQSRDELGASSAIQSAERKIRQAFAGSQASDAASPGLRPQADLQVSNLCFVLEPHV
jgi:hypothetical protein